MFISPTHGALSFEDTIERVSAFLTEEGSYRLIVGTDSQSYRNGVLFVSAIVIHRIGRGGIYFYRRLFNDRLYGFKERIFTETSLSLSLAGKLLCALAEDPERSEYYRRILEIHLDVGEQGETREIINAVVGMVKGSGFAAQVKPEAFGACSVADKHSKVTRHHAA